MGTVARTRADRGRGEGSLMGELFGFVVFALGILIAVCVHEAGHMGTAKAFGMKVSRYFVGFGPTLWSFRRGETEYGVKALPLGGFVKIVGMTPQDDDVDPADEPRAMWRLPVGARDTRQGAGLAGAFALMVGGALTLVAVLRFPGTHLGRPRRAPREERGV